MLSEKNLNNYLVVTLLVSEEMCDTTYIAHHNTTYVRTYVRCYVTAAGQEARSPTSRRPAGALLLPPPVPGISVLPPPRHTDLQQALGVHPSGEPVWCAVCGVCVEKEKKENSSVFC